MKYKGWSIVALCGIIATLAMNLSGKEDAVPKKAPASFKVKFETTAGNFIIEVHRDWARNGVDRFYHLVKTGFYDECKFFRVVPDFMVQFGINGDPEVSRKWLNARIKDDPVMKSNKRGFITFAKGGPNSRTTQVFINYKDNPKLDIGFPAFGKVIEGMDVVDSIYSGYGENEEGDQMQIQMKGNAFLEKKYPKLDAIISATIMQDE